jgi:hypothetical protein
MTSSTLSGKKDPLFVSKAMKDNSTTENASLQSVIDEQCNCGGAHESPMDRTSKGRWEQSAAGAWPYGKVSDA